MKKINITETVLRDANQSLIATRLPFEDFAPILKDLDDAGYYSLECWGGATFDSCLRYLNEDPWERLKNIKTIVTKTPLQMLLRGQNILGYKHYPDDVVREFIKMSVYHGMDIIRIFDALNDFANIEVAMNETIKQGAHAQGTIVYTVSPIHDVKNYTKLAKQLENMGANSICIKDMAGLIMPSIAYDIVKSIKETVKIPVFLHSHSTNGIAEMAYFKAAEAGVDGIDCSISSFSSGTAQPPTESMHHALETAGFETGLNIGTLTQINNFFKPVRSKVLEAGLLDPKVLTPQPEGLTNQIPGGERYKMVLKEVKAYCRGEYGKAPGKINEDVLKKALGNDTPIEGRYADTLEPAFQKTKEELKNITTSEEDILSYLAFPQIAEEFFKKRSEKPSNDDMRKLTNSEVI